MSGTGIGGFGLAFLLLLGFLTPLFIYIMQPYADRRFPRLTFIRDVFDKAAGVKAKPFRQLKVFVIQAALLFCLLPHLIAVCHLFTPLCSKEFTTYYFILKQEVPYEYDTRI